jgi:acetyltransferase-like isoleucine patch superfamily enzyme
MSFPREEFIIEMTTNFRRYPGVQLGKGSQIYEYVVLGVPPKDSGGALKTFIGQRALIRSHTVIYAGNSIGVNFQTGHGVLIRELNKIGNNVSIGSHSIIEHHIGIGDNVRIHSNVFIPEYTIVEDSAWIGPNAVFSNARYPMSAGVKDRLKGPYIGEGAKIGANAVLLPGIIIGKHALIGAGAVVVKDVPDYKVVAGNPARNINDIRKIPEYRME